LTFLNPAILWGLAAVSIPIIIHIFNLKRTKKIEFSTLMFLKEIQQSKYKKIKLKQLLILLCRIAFIIFLILAFARPFESGYLGFAGSKARSTVLLLLDDSFSMLTRESGGTNFDAAKSKVLETIYNLGEKDEIYFIPISKISIPGYSGLYRNINELRDSVNAAQISDVTKELDEILYYSKKLMDASNNPFKEVFLFTDGQKSTLTGKINNTADFTGKEKTNLNLVLTGIRKGNDLSLDTINVVTKIFERNKHVKLKCTVTNHNAFDVSNKSVILNFSTNKPYREEKVVDIPANSSADVEFNFIPNVTGYAGGSIELQQSDISEDEIANDNKKYFAINVPEKVKMLLVAGVPSDAEFIRLALSSSEEMMRDSTNNKINFFDITQIQANEFESASGTLKNYQSVVIVNKNTFSNNETDRLLDYIQSGGGVIIYPADNSSIQNYNETMLRKLDIPFINSGFGSEGVQTKFERIDYEHPVFEGIFKYGSEKNAMQESPAIYRGWNLSPANNSISLVKMTNGNSFLTEYRSGKGKLLFYAVSPDMRNSNFPSVNLFSPLTVRSIMYLANNNPVKEAVNGKDYLIDINLVNEKQNTDTINIRSTVRPGNVNTFSLSEYSTVNLKNYLNYSSNYFLSANSKDILAVPSNFDKKETFFDRITDDEIKNEFVSYTGINVNIIKPADNYMASLQNLRNGKELWQFFLILALLFVAAEYAISRSIYFGDKNHKSTVK